LRPFVGQVTRIFEKRSAAAPNPFVRCRRFNRSAFTANALNSHFSLKSLAFSVVVSLSLSFAPAARRRLIVPDFHFCFPGNFFAPTIPAHHSHPVPFIAFPHRVLQGLFAVFLAIRSAFARGSTGFGR